MTRLRRYLAYALPLTTLTACDHDVARSVPPVPTTLQQCRSRLDPEELLPPDAVVVAMYDMDRERRHAPRKGDVPAVGLRTAMPAEMEALRAGWVSIAAACELDERFFGKAWVSFDDDADVLAVIEGRGIGDAENLRCVRQRVARWGDEELAEDAVIASDGCGVTVRVDDIVGFAPTEDLLVLGSEDAVDEALHTWNFDVPRPPTALLPPRRNRSYVWAAANLDALLGDQRVGEAFDTGRDDIAGVVGLRDAWAQAELQRHFDLQLAGRFATEADARAAEGVLAAWIASPPPVLPAWARELVRKVRLERDATEVSLSLPLDKQTAQQAGLVPTRVEAEQMPALVWAVGLALTL